MATRAGVILAVEDVERSTAFYRDALGFEVDDVADPAILQPGDAIVSVRATAICGADLFPFHGLTPGFEMGTILGHEFAGEIVEVGAEVASIRPGDRVVNASMISDGTCPSCRA